MLYLLIFYSCYNVGNFKYQLFDHYYMNTRFGTRCRTLSQYEKIVDCCIADFVDIQLFCMYFVLSHLSHAL